MVGGSGCRWLRGGSGGGGEWGGMGVLLDKLLWGLNPHLFGSVSSFTAHTMKTQDRSWSTPNRKSHLVPAKEEVRYPDG